MTTIPIHGNISNEEVLDLIHVAVLSLDDHYRGGQGWDEYTMALGISVEGLERLHEKAKALITLSQESIHADPPVSETNTDKGR